MVDLISKLRIKIPQWVVRQRRQMYHCVEAFQVGLCQIAEIFANFRNRFQFPEVAAFVKVGIDAHNRVARGPQERPCHSSDVTLMTGEQYAHRYDSLPCLQV